MFDFISALEQSTAMLTVDQVAALLKISNQSVRRMVSSRQIPSFRVGGHRRFDPKVLYWWYVKKHPDALRARQANLP